MRQKTHELFLMWPKIPIYKLNKGINTTYKRPQSGQKHAALYHNNMQINASVFSDIATCN